MCVKSALAYRSLSYILCVASSSSSSCSSFRNFFSANFRCFYYSFPLLSKAFSKCACPRVFRFSYKDVLFPKRYNSSLSFSCVSPYSTASLPSSKIVAKDELVLESQEAFQKTFGAQSRKKPHVLILGTGWAAMHFFTNISPEKYEISLVSPRNYFTFTPLLPSVCSGTLSPLACIEPVRKFTRVNGKLIATLYECICTDVHFKEKKVFCETGQGDQFSLNYDYLVISIGSETKTFNISGVDKYASFLKEVEHAIDIRKKIMNNFERAALPITPSEERERLLSFVVVGGGPTGVETVAEFADFVTEDMTKYFPELIPFVKLTIVEANTKLLPMFSTKVSEYAAKVFEKKLNIRVLLQHAVIEVKEKSVILENRQNGIKEIIELPQGFVLWASGVGQTKLARNIISKITEQHGNVVMKVNSRLQLKGVQGVYALGDCACVEPHKLSDNVQKFFNEALKAGSCKKWFEDELKKLSLNYPQLSPLKWNFKKHPIPLCTELHEFSDYLNEIDKSYIPPTPTAQNARQQGLYLADVFNKFFSQDEKNSAHAFQETWSGSLAYIGSNEAVATMPHFDILGGYFSLPLWKAVYTQMQLTWRSRTICLFDWLRTFFAGRDVGRDHRKL